MQRRSQAPYRRGRKVCAAGAIVSVAAMRLRFHRGGKPSRRGRAVGEVADDCGTGRRGLGQLACIDPFISAKRNPKNAGSPLPRGRTAEEEGRMSPRNKPPFPADHVGTLLRPAALKKAREQRVRGEISPPDLTELEDREIERIIRQQ